MQTLCYGANLMRVYWAQQAATVPHSHTNASMPRLQDEIAEMRRKFKIMDHQIEQLKEEISAKDLALVKEHFDHTKAGNLVPVLQHCSYVAMAQAACDYPVRLVGATR